jgi:hypothetical protein
MLDSLSLKKSAVRAAACPARSGFLGTRSGRGPVTGRRSYFKTRVTEAE